jgi:hypothetical protein
LILSEWITTSSVFGARLGMEIGCTHTEISIEQGKVGRFPSKGRAMSEEGETYWRSAGGYGELGETRR